jgi:hypothetical protein
MRTYRKDYLMFGRTPKEATVRLNAAMTHILDEMETFGPDSPEYSAMLGHLERVNALRKSEDRREVSPDTMFLVIGNLLGILIIVAYEQKHVMSSKSLPFVLKPK